MTAATGTPVSARDDHGTGQAPGPKPHADLETVLAGLAFQAIDLPLDFTDAARRLLLSDQWVNEWDAYVHAVETVHKLETGADPFMYGDANPGRDSAGAAHEAALQDWTSARDAQLRFLVAAAARRYEQNGQAA